MYPSNTRFNSAVEILWNKSDNNESDNRDVILDEVESEAVNVFDLAIANLYAKRA